MFFYLKPLINQSVFLDKVWKGLQKKDSCTQLSIRQYPQELVHDQHKATADDGTISIINR